MVYYDTPSAAAELAREFVRSWKDLMDSIDDEPLNYIPEFIDAIAELGEQTPRSVRDILLDFIPGYGKECLTNIINLHYHIDENMYDLELPFK